MITATLFHTKIRAIAMKHRFHTALRIKLYNKPKAVLPKCKAKWHKDLLYFPCNPIHTMLTQECSICIA